MVSRFGWVYLGRSKEISEEINCTISGGGKKQLSKLWIVYSLVLLATSEKQVNAERELGVSGIGAGLQSIV